MEKAFYKECLKKEIQHLYCPMAEIGAGLRLIHPSGLYITRAKIGDNFTVYQNCTIGIKGEDKREETFVHIGNNVTMYSNSSIIGNVEVLDDCVLGAFSCLLTSAKSSGVFVRIPAKKI